jgi:asparagine synthase (glutamine-hydrolysing)
VTLSLSTFSEETLEDNTLPNWLDPCRAEDVAHDLECAVAMRLRADVPIGILLSGGVDSTAIAAMAHKINAGVSNIRFYTARYASDVSSDLPYARQVARDLGISISEIEMDMEKSAITRYRRMTAKYDLPVAFGGATTGMNILYEAMSKDGVKVVLDGTGGDEIFGGYVGAEYMIGGLNGLLASRRFTAAFTHFRIWRDKKTITNHQIARWLYSRITNCPTFGTPLRHIAQFIAAPYRDAALKSGRSFWGTTYFRETLSEVQLRDCMFGRLPAFTEVADNNAMMYSMDNRSPFLDVNLIKYIGMNETEKYRNGFNKYALRQAMPHTIDQAVTWRPEKQGARFPVQQFIDNHRSHMESQIATCDVLTQLFDLRGLLTHLRGHPLARHMLPGLYAVAQLADIYPLRLSET